MTEDKNTEIVEKAAVATKKKQENKKLQQDDIIVLASGIRVKYFPVAANVILEAQTRIKAPVIPMVPHPNPKEEGQVMENPNSPAYQAELIEYKKLQARAGMDAMLLMGLELVDGLPESDDWLDKLVFLKLIKQKEVNQGIDKFTRELWYKKFIVVDASVLTELATRSGVTQEAVAQATNSFPGDA